ncbi:MAG TPA: hypothetical protein VGD91_27615, partial [Trebonia sp.]
MDATAAGGADTGLPYAGRPITWESTGNGEFPYRATAGGAELLVRVNDFPAQPLYSLLADGQLDQDLEDWPACWTRPGTPPEQLRQAADTQVRRGRIDAVVTAAWANILCLLSPSPAADTAAALGLTGALTEATGYRLLGPGSAVPRVHSDSPFQLCYRVTV